jgi:hypothetical protein
MASRWPSLADRAGVPEKKAASIRKAQRLDLTS